MTKFYSTKEFREQIIRLTHKQKNGYSSVILDICENFKSRTIKDIRINRDMLRSEDAFTLIKLRIANSHLKLTKKDGFRLIYYVSKKDDCVVMLSVYPKRGAMGLNTISDNGIKLLLEEFIKEKRENLLIEHDIADSLNEISKSSNIEDGQELVFEQAKSSTHDAIQVIEKS